MSGLPPIQTPVVNSQGSSSATRKPPHDLVLGLCKLFRCPASPASSTRRAHLLCYQRIIYLPQPTPSAFATGRFSIGHSFFTTKPADCEPTWVNTRSLGKYHGLQSRRIWPIWACVRTSHLSREFNKCAPTILETKRSLTRCHRNHPAQEVYVTGDFDNWSKSVKLEKTGDSFRKTITLPGEESRIHYKVRTVPSGASSARD